MGSIRRLRKGESIPSGMPRRYVTVDGYRLLRWKVGVAQYVEVLEHRVVDGMVTTAGNVHHRDYNRQNNHPDNLLYLSPLEHQHHHRDIDRRKVVEYYQRGLSTPEVGRALGCHHSQVYRILVSEGVTVRSISEALQLNIDPGLVARLHNAGVRARRIAKALKCSATPIERLIDDLGLEPHRDGRPTNVEIQAAQRALTAEGLV